MEFEFDHYKSATNKTKHGIDFIEAQKLWADANFLEIPARTTAVSSYWQYC
ncbi:BrnT family toxin [Nostoc sp.]|uniref:BrnT family toxin n=1 Tax=Nostoc sp. TaxID=1180 RepID=UPI002FF474C5